MSEHQTEQVTADMVATEAPKTKQPVGGYRALAIIAFVIAVGGLFLGLLSKWIGFLSHSPVFETAGGVLDGSLIGFIISYVKSIFSIGLLTYLREIIYRPLNVADTALLLSSLMTAIAVVLSLVFVIVALCSRKAAKNCAVAGMTLVLLGYAGLFLTGFYAERLAFDGLSRAMFDVPTGIISIVALVSLVICAFVRRKGLGLVNFLLFVLTLLTVYALCNRDSLFNQLTVFGGTGGLRDSLFFGISTLAFLALLAFNFTVSAARLNAKESYLFDVFRFVLLLVTSLLSFLSHGLKTSWALFDTQMLSVVLMLAAPLAALLLSLLVAIVKASKARRVEAEETSKTIGMPSDASDTEEPSDAFAQTAEETAAPAHADAPAQAEPVQTAFAHAEHEQPSAAAQTSNAFYANKPAADDFRDNTAQNTSAFQQKSTEYPYTQNPASSFNSAMYGQQYAQQPMGIPFYPMPFYTAAAAEQNNAKSGKPAQEPKQEGPMSEFERSMAALAKGLDPETANTSSAAYNPSPTPPYTPPMGFAQSAAYTRPASAPAPAAAAYDTSQYTYDPFINSLTMQEKNEFGDLFIANKFGDLSYLPAYVIGGDNHEFFSKVFIYVGRFRGHISSALLNKLYVYVSRN